MDLSYQLELALWEVELTKLVEGNKKSNALALKRLKELKSIRNHDAPGAQNWIFKISGSAQNNEKFKKAQISVHSKLKKLSDSKGVNNE